MANIILLEDSPALRRILTRQLTEAGHAITAFPDGAALRDPQTLRGADILVTDLAMPGVDGFYAVARARTVRPAMPVLAITGLPCGLLPPTPGIDAILPKPVDEPDLLATIARLLESRKRMQDESQNATEEASEEAIPPDELHAALQQRYERVRYLLDLRKAA